MSLSRIIFIRITLELLRFIYYIRDCHSLHLLILFLLNVVGLDECQLLSGILVNVLLLNVSLLNVSLLNVSLLNAECQSAEC
jgi:hypothetical protein